MTEKIENNRKNTYDDKNRIIKIEYINGVIRDIEYDDENRRIHEKTTTGFEYHKEYNEFGRLTHYSDSKGNERWFKYDESGNMIYHKSSVLFGKYTEEYTVHHNDENPYFSKIENDIKYKTTFLLTYT